MLQRSCITAVVLNNKVLTMHVLTMLCNTLMFLDIQYCTTVLCRPSLTARHLLNIDFRSNSIHIYLRDIIGQEITCISYVDRS